MINKLVIYKRPHARDVIYQQKGSRILAGNEIDMTYIAVEYRVPKTDELIATITKQQYTKYMSDKRAKIQDVMPELNEDQREFIISGLTGAQFDALFEEKESKNDLPSGWNEEDYLEAEFGHLDEDETTTESDWNKE